MIENACQTLLFPGNFPWKYFYSVEDLVSKQGNFFFPKFQKTFFQNPILSRFHIILYHQQDRGLYFQQMKT